VSLLCPSLFLVSFPSAWFTRVMGEPSHDGKEGDITTEDGLEHVFEGICTQDRGINVNKIGEKLSYKQILANSSPIFLASIEFDGIFRRIPVETECGGASGNGGWATIVGCGLTQEGGAITGDGGGEDGKVPSLDPKVLSLSPNEDMISTIKGEQSRLKSIAIFFVCLDKEFMLARKFFDD